MRLGVAEYLAAFLVSAALAWGLTPLMLRLAGFEVEALYGGFEGEPFTATSDHLLALARNG